MTSPANEKVRILKLLLHAVFFLSGIATVLIGQVLPILARNFLLNDLQSGYLFPAQFAGSIIGTFLTNWFGKQNKFLAATSIGCACMAVGVLLMNVDSFEVCLVAFAINGFGIGLTLPSVNMLVLEFSPSNSASALSLLNFCWGVGAIVCKPFVDLFSSGGTSILVVTTVLAVLLFSAIILISIMPKITDSASDQQVDDRPHSDVPIWVTPLAWTIALFNFVQVGFESGMGGWLASYTDRVEGQAVTHLLSPTFLYFLFFVIGRGIAPVFFRFLSENQMLFVNLALMLVGTSIVLLADGLGLLTLGAAISGFGASSVFPTNLSRFTKAFGPAASRRAMPLFICGTLGATTVTWLIGFVSDQSGSLRLGMFIILGSVLILIVLQLVLTFGPSTMANKSVPPA